MAYIGTDINYGNIASQTGTGDGSDTTPIDPLSYSVPTSASIIVTLDGVTQVPTTDYVASGTTLTFTTAPVNLVKILVVFLGRSLDLGTPADNTVTNAKMANNAIDSAELVAGSVDDAHLATGITASKLSGVVPTANLGTGTASSTTVLYGDGTYKAEPVTDLTAVRQDIAMLALYNAVSDNRAAYNLPFSFIDQFEDDTGITTETTVDRSLSGEYVSSVSAGVGKTATLNANSGTAPVMSSTQAKFGTYSAYFAGNGGTLNFADSNDFDFGVGNFTIEYWLYPTTAGRQKLRRGSTDYTAYFLGEGGNLAYATVGGTSWDLISAKTLGTESTGVWQHYALVRNGSVFTCYRDGVSVATEGATGVMNDRASEILSIGGHTGQPSSTYHGYMDEIRISDSARYTTGFSVETSPFTTDANTMLLLHMDDAGLTDSSVADTVNATGTLISDQQTAPALTKMSGVVLVKDGGSSTTVMGTHLKIYFSATGAAASFPSAWVEAASYTAVTAPFSTGVTMYKLGETTVPSGTLPTIRAVWASQTSGGFESQLHGWAMNY